MSGKIRKGGSEVVLNKDINPSGFTKDIGFDGVVANTNTAIHAELSVMTNGVSKKATDIHSGEKKLVERNPVSYNISPKYLLTKPCNIGNHWNKRFVFSQLFNSLKKDSKYIKNGGNMEDYVTPILSDDFISQRESLLKIIEKNNTLLSLLDSKSKNDGDVIRSMFDKYKDDLSYLICVKKNQGYRNCYAGYLVTPKFIEQFQGIIQESKLDTNQQKQKELEEKDKINTIANIKFEKSSEGNKINLERFWSHASKKIMDEENHTVSISYKKCIGDFYAKIYDNNTFNLKDIDSKALYDIILTDENLFTLFYKWMDSFIRSEVKRYKAITRESDFIIEQNMGRPMEPRKKSNKKPTLDYYDNKRDGDFPYEGRFGKYDED